MSYLNDNLQYLAKRLRKFLKTFKKKKGWEKYRLWSVFQNVGSERNFITGIINITRGEQIIQRRVLLVVPAQYNEVIHDVDFSNVFNNDIKIQEELTDDDMPAYIFRLYIEKIGERSLEEI